MWIPLLLAALQGGASPVGDDPVDAPLPDAYAALRNEERITPEVRVVQAATPSVVFIETEYTQTGNSMLWGPIQRTYSGSGSGAVVHPDGYIVTNYHVVNGAQRIRVSFAGDPQRHAAQLVSFVRAEDLALLKVETGGPFQPVVLGTSSDLWQGERVIAIGNPYGQTHTVSTGIISGLHRDVEVPEHHLAFRDLIQTDASINFGNSGGPLLNIRGELIGINNAMNTRAENIGFAIPVDRVREVLTDILYPQARKTWLGFDLAESESLVVGRVWPEGPAAASGVCEGDRIVSVGGRPVTDSDSFLHATLQIEPQEKVALGIERGGRSDTVTIPTWDRVDGTLFERLGMTVRERVLGRQRWVFVDQVSVEGPAADLGLEIGDLIPAVQPRTGRRPAWRINSRDSLAQIVLNLPTGTEIDLDVYRDKNSDRDYTRDERYEGTLVIR